MTMPCEIDIADIETGETRTEKRSLFCRVPWLSRDVVLGVCLALAWLCGLQLFSHTWIANVSPCVTWPIGMLLEMVFLLAYPIWVVYRRVARPISFFPGIGATAKEFAIAIPLAIGVLVVTALLGYLLSKVSSQDSLTPKVWRNIATYANWRTGIMLLVCGTTLAPIIEEIFSRGFLYNAIARRSTPIIAACLQSLFFAAMHRYDAMPFAVVFLIGLILAAIYAWRRTLLAPLFVHAIYNFMGLAAMTVAILHNANAPVLGVYGTTCHEGVRVNRVETGSAADDCGIRPGDVIVSYNGLPVTDFERLVQLVRKGRVGETVRIHVRRNGTVTEMKATPRRSH